MAGADHCGNCPDNRETRGAKLAEITTPEVLAKQRAQLLPDEWERLQEVRAAAFERVKHGQKVETAAKRKRR